MYRFDLAAVVVPRHGRLAGIVAHLAVTEEEHCAVLAQDPLQITRPTGSHRIADAALFAHMALAAGVVQQAVFADHTMHRTVFRETAGAEQVRSTEGTHIRRTARIAQSTAGAAVGDIFTRTAGAVQTGLDGTADAHTTFGTTVGQETRTALRTVVRSSAAGAHIAVVAVADAFFTQTAVRADAVQLGAVVAVLAMRRTVDAYIAVRADIGAIRTETTRFTVRLARGFRTGIAVGTGPVVHAATIHTMVAAACALAYIIVAGFTVRAMIPVRNGTIHAQFLFCAYIGAVFAPIAGNTAQYTVVTKTAVRTGFNVFGIFCMAVYADLVAPGTGFHTVRAFEAEHTVVVAVMADGAVRTSAVFFILDIAFPAVFAGHVFIQVTFQTDMIGSGGTFTAAIVAKAAAGVGAELRGAVAAAGAVICLVAVTAAFFTAVVAAVADVVVAADGAAEFAFNYGIPRKSFQRTRTENQQQTQQQTEDFLCLFLFLDYLNIRSNIIF